LPLRRSICGPRGRRTWLAVTVMLRILLQWTDDLRTAGPDLWPLVRGRPDVAGRRDPAGVVMRRRGCGPGAAGRPDHFEYSSTTSASLMSAGRSARSGTALNTPVNFLASTSTQDGIRSCCSARVRASWTRSCFCAFSDSEIVSPALTWYDGRLTGLPLTSTPRCETSWRADGRVTAKPMRYTTLSRRVSSSCRRFSPVLPFRVEAFLE